MEDLRDLDERLDAQLAMERYRPAPNATAIPAYSTDRNACALAEAEIARIGLSQNYVSRLIDQLALPPGWFADLALPDYLARFLLAPPDVRVRAMLATLTHASSTRSSSPA